MRTATIAGMVVFSHLAASCGARTGLESEGAADAAAAEAVCTEAPWIVFDYSNGSNGYRLAAVHPDGSGFRLLDLGGTAGFAPAISPDGHSLLYVTGTEADESLRIRDLRTGNTRTLVHATTNPVGGGITRPAVSPDGAWVAYGNVPDLHLVAADGTGDRVLVHGPYEAGCCSWGYGHPVFSPDSARIFVATIGRLERVARDGTGRVLIWQDRFFANRTIPGFVFPNPSISPDGQQLVAQVGCATSELRVYDLAALPPADPCTAGTHLAATGLTQASNEAANPAWGPTGLVAYGLGKDIVVIDPRGGTPTNVTAALTTAPNAVAADPTWAPPCAAIP